MPRNSVATLENLCVWSLVFNWDKITSGCIDGQLLRCIPEYVLYNVKRQLTLAKGLLTYHDFRLLHTCRSLTHLHFEDFLFTPAECLKVFHYLTTHSWRLQHLTLSQNLIHSCIEPPTSDSLFSQTFEKVLQSLSRLRSLSFRSTSCKNWMLKIVARSCPLLQELDLSCCPDVEDEGILSFCDSLDEYGVKGTCDMRRIWLVETKVTSTALLELFLTFPHLELCHHPDLLNSVFNLTGKAWSLAESREIKNIDVTPLLTDVVCHSTWLSYLEVPSCLTSSISCLELSGLTPEIDLNFLSQFNNLIDLTLSSCPIARRCGVDLDLLANSCQHLKHLALRVKGPLSLTRSFATRSFQSLETLDVDRGGCKSLSPTDALRLLVGCTGISRLSLEFCPWLTDKILDDLLRCNPLTNAKEVYFYGSKLSFDGILTLLHLPNEMRLLSVGTELLGKRHHFVVGNYIRKNNWQLILKLQTASSNVD